MTTYFVEWESAFGEVRRSEVKAYGQCEAVDIALYGSADAIVHRCFAV